MEEINLEKIDIIRQRCNVTYLEAKEALEISNGNVIDALIYIEQKEKSKNEDIFNKEELISYIKELINKGNVSRIKVKKDDEVVLDIPVNAGIATGLLSLVYPPLLALGFLTALITKVTIEITRTDGTVEVVNKIIKTTVNDVKDKFNDLSKDVKDKMDGFSTEMKEKVGDISHDVKDKAEEFTSGVKEKFTSKKEDEKPSESSEKTFTYTVKFDDETSKDDK